jgi:hypothetical protein
LAAGAVRVAPGFVPGSGIVCVTASVEGSIRVMVAPTVLATGMADWLVW